MADVKISELEALETVKESDMLVVVDTENAENPATKNTTLKYIADYIKTNNNIYIIRLTIASGSIISNGTTIEWTKGYNYTTGQIEVYWNGHKLIEKEETNSDGHYIANNDGNTASITMYRTDDDGDYELTEDVQVEIIIHQYINNATFVNSEE